jgi:hypothetical protein
MLINLSQPGEFCYSFSWITDIIDVILKISLNVLECDYGLLGALLTSPWVGNNGLANCRWRRYEPLNPLY